MLEGFAKLFKNYRMATGVYLFSTKEKLVWDLVFLITIIVFILGIFHLIVGTYHSFVRVFFSNIINDDKVIKNT